MIDLNAVHLGDCLEVMREWPDNIIDSVVTDPPYGLSEEPDMVEVLTHWLAGDDYKHRGSGFMGKSWDSFVPGPATWREVYRVLKPGATLLCFAGQRTQDLMGISLRLAGFEVTDTIMWVFGAGFPKSHNVSRAIDKAAIVDCPDCVGTIGCYQMEKRLWRKAMLWLMVQKPAMRLRKYLKRRKIENCEGCKGSGKVKGAEREVVGVHVFPDGTTQRATARAGIYSDQKGQGTITAPATPEAALFEGYGSAIKPAYEPILVCRKPNDGTFANNAIVHGVSGLNIDGTRVETDGSKLVRPSIKRNDNNVLGKGFGAGTQSEPQGRYPPNLLLECNCTAGQGGNHAPDCVCGMLDKDSGHLNSGKVEAHHKNNAQYKSYGGGFGNSQSERGFGDSGGASRFFPNLLADAARFKYSPKAPQSERQFTRHPTQKPLALMRWLCRLTRTPTGGIVLDPFAGSGTTLEAATLEGRPYIGIEQDPTYYQDILERLAHIKCEPYERPAKPEKKDEIGQLKLW